MPYYYNRKKTARKEKKEAMPLFSAAGVRVERKTDLVRKLDKVFSLYIRLRDTMPGGVFRCIACGQIKPFEQADCGHYFSRTHMATRYSELNCHAECRHCNRFRADHLDGYRRNLVAKIGTKMFDLLTMQHNQTVKYSDFELQELIKVYQDKAKEIKKKKGL